MKWLKWMDCEWIDVNGASNENWMKLNECNEVDWRQLNDVWSEEKLMGQDSNSSFLIVMSDWFNSFFFKYGLLVVSYSISMDSVMNGTIWN